MPTLTKRIDGTRSASIFGVLSQGVNSGSNFLLALAVAATTAPTDLGSWSILYTILTFALSVSRSVISTSFLLRQRDHSYSEARSGLYTLNVALGLVTALGVLGAGLLLDFWLACAIALALPVVLLQDSLRYVAFADHQPRVAIGLDVTWITIQVTGSAFLLLTHHASPASLTVVWLLGAAAGCCLVLRPGFRARFRYRLARRYVSLERKALKGLSYESVLIAAAANSTPIIVGLFAGLAGAGAFRLALTLIGPLAIVVAGLTPLATVRVQQVATYRGQWLFLARWTGLVAALAAAAGGVFLAIPDRLADRLLGPSWVLASSLMLPLLVQAALRGPLTAVPILLRTQRDFTLLVRLSVITSIITVSSTLIGSISHGELGASWGLVVASCIGVLLYCWGFSINFRPRHHEEPVR